MQPNPETRTGPEANRAGELNNGLLGGTSGIILPRLLPRVNTALRHHQVDGGRFGQP
jgi:hypothetical protein